MPIFEEFYKEYNYKKYQASMRDNLSYTVAK